MIVYSESDHWVSCTLWYDCESQAGKGGGMPHFIVHACVCVGGCVRACVRALKLISTCGKLIVAFDFLFFRAAVELLCNERHIYSPVEGCLTEK